MLLAGLGAFALALLTGVLALLFGRLAGAGAFGAGDAESAPVSGSVPADRHQNIAASSPR
jgi:hypothetical protein